MRVGRYPVRILIERKRLLLGILGFRLMSLRRHGPKKLMAKVKVGAVSISHPQ
jgi:hypothetical protein